MAKRDIKEKVLQLRAEGKSYSQIREVITVSKSTLSVWLKNKPLTPSQLGMLQGKNEKRIENFRSKMLIKRNEKIKKSLVEASKDIGIFSQRDIFVGGIFLYFGEGSKTTKNTTALTNSNPFILKFFILWLGYLNVKRSRIRAKLYLYKDMDKEKEIIFWTKSLNITRNQIRGPYVKSSNQSDITYKNSYGHGTCTVLVEDAVLFRKVSAYLKYTTDHFE